MQDQRKASADALQKAISALEGETGGDTSSIYYVLAVSIFATVRMVFMRLIFILLVVALPRKSSQ